MIANKEQWKIADAGQKAAEKMRVLRALDLDCYFTRDVIGGHADPDSGLRALHQLRYEEPEAGKELRDQSEAWLKESGYRRLRNVDWPV